MVHAIHQHRWLVVAGTMFAGWLAASDAYGFHGDEMYHVARAKPVEQAPAAPVFHRTLAETSASPEQGRRGYLGG